MIRLFQNDDQDRAIREDGYLVLPILSEGQVEALRAVYDEHLSGNVDASHQPYDVYECTGDNDRETNHLVNEELRRILAPTVHALFRDFEHHGGSFLVRTPQHRRELPLHQDWSVIDETRDDQVFLWMPLQATSKENGAIFLVPGSHRFFREVRSGSFPSKRIDRKAIPRRFVRTIELRPGEVLFYKPNIFHGSFPNRSGADRVVATSYITNRGADLVYYHRTDPGTIAKYAVSPDSYIEDINQLAKGVVPESARLLESTPNEHRQVSRKMLLEALNAAYGHRSQLKETISKLLSKKA